MRSQVFAILAALLVLVAVVFLLRRHRLRERHAIWWMFAAFLALLAGIVPDTIVRVASWLGIDIPLNLVFFTSIAILFLVNLQHAAELTSLETKTRILAEKLALLEMERDDAPPTTKDKKKNRST